MAQSASLARPAAPLRPEPAPLKIHDPYEPQMFGLIPQRIWSAKSLSLSAKAVLGGLAVLAKGVREGVWASLRDLAAACGCDPRTARKALAELTAAGVVAVDGLCRSFRFHVRFLFRLRPPGGSVPALREEPREVARPAPPARKVCALLGGPPGPPYKEKREREETTTEVIGNSTVPREAGPLCPPPLLESSRSQPEPEPQSQEALPMPTPKPEPHPSPRLYAGAAEEPAERLRRERTEAIGRPTVEELIREVQGYWPETHRAAERVGELAEIFGVREASQAIRYAWLHPKTRKGLDYAFATARRWQADGYDLADMAADVAAARPKPKITPMQNFNPLEKPEPRPEAEAKPTKTEFELTVANLKSGVKWFREKNIATLREWVAKGWARALWLDECGIGPEGGEKTPAAGLVAKRDPAAG